MTDAAAVHARNAAGWNQTSRWYAEQVRQAIPLLRDGGVTLHQVETRLLKRLGWLSDWCDVAIHLQCAAGMDTHSLANLGAGKVVGVDIAEELIALARDLSQELRDETTAFVCADVLEVPPELHGTADLVYTGKGAVHWIFDLKRWGQEVARLLKPGGWFMLFDFHPMMWLFRGDVPTMTATGTSYFAPVLSYREWAAGHIGDLGLSASELEIKRLRPWPPSAVIQALLDAGLILRSFGEYPDALSEQWTAFPSLAHEDRRKIASTYSLLARKPPR